MWSTDGFVHQVDIGDISLPGIYDGEIFCLTCSYVGNCSYWAGRLIPFSFHKAVWCDRSTHMRMESVFFFGVTTMRAHQSVGSVTGAIMCCCSNNFSLAANSSRYAKGMIWVM